MLGAGAASGVVELLVSSRSPTNASETPPLALMLKHNGPAEPCQQASNATIVLGPATSQKGVANKFVFSIVATSGRTVRLAAQHCAGMVPSVCLAVVEKRLGLGGCSSAQAAFTRIDV